MWRCAVDSQTQLCNMLTLPERSSEGSPCCVFLDKDGAARTRSGATRRIYQAAGEHGNPQAAMHSQLQKAVLAKLICSENCLNPHPEEYK